MSNAKQPAAPRMFPLEQIATELAATGNACDERKSRDLLRLAELSACPWSGRLLVEGLSAGPGRSLDLACRLKVSGLGWQGEPQPHDAWTLTLSVPHHYPLAQPEVRFVGEVPYNPHVVHRDFVPEDREVPAEFRAFLSACRSGFDGGCCYLRGSQWSSALAFDLALVLWQTSRIVCGQCLYAERGALNLHARDHYLRLAGEGGLPLGEPLPAEGNVLVSPVTLAELNASADGDEEAIRWTAEGLQ